MSSSKITRETKDEKIYEGIVKDINLSREELCQKYNLGQREILAYLRLIGFDMLFNGCDIEDVRKTLRLSEEEFTYKKKRKEDMRLKIIELAEKKKDIKRIAKKCQIPVKQVLFFILVEASKRYKEGHSIEEISKSMRLPHRHRKILKGIVQNKHYYF